MQYSSIMQSYIAQPLGDPAYNAHGNIPWHLFQNEFSQTVL